MERKQPRAVAAALGGLFALTGATTLASDAQTWHWKYETHTPGNPLLAAQSTVTISPNAAVRMTYTLPVDNRQVVIESCNANLNDIEGAATLRTQGATYLLIRFKPSHNAACASGSRPAVALPADDGRYLDRVAAAINRSCCSIAHSPTAAPRTPAPTPTPRPLAVAKTDSPTPSPAKTEAPTPSPVATVKATPSPTPTPAALQDWVETEGLFWFVRVRNTSRAPITVTGEVFDCRNVDAGCGPFARKLELDPSSAATVAAIASANRGDIPSFQYRYTGGDGANTITGSGSSTKSVPRNVARMSVQELRAAQADALGQLRSAARGTPAPITPARLVKRGSSRLGIGQTGTALVRLTIAANGTPEEVTIVSITNKQLTAAAIETAVSSTYAPATQNGRAVAAKYVATFSFDGEDPALATVPMWKRALSSPSPSPSSPSSPPLSPSSPASTPTLPSPPTPPAPSVSQSPSPLFSTSPTPLSGTPAPRIQ